MSETQLEVKLYDKIIPSPDDCHILVYNGSNHFNYLNKVTVHEDFDLKRESTLSTTDSIYKNKPSSLNTTNDLSAIVEFWPDYLAW